MEGTNYEELERLERESYACFLEKIPNERRKEREEAIGYILPESDLVLSNEEFQEEFPKVFSVLARMGGFFLHCVGHRSPSLLILFLHMLRCPFCCNAFFRDLKLQKWDT